MDKSFLEGGDFDRFIVINTKKDIDNLSLEQLVALDNICHAVSEERRRQGKNPEPTYLVINTDEPYAPEIVEILKRNGHWG